MMMSPDLPSGIGASQRRPRGRPLSTLPGPSEPRAEPPHVREAVSDKEMVPHDRSQDRKRDRDPVGGGVETDDDLDVERLMSDVTSLPRGHPLPPQELKGLSCQGRKAANERHERPMACST